MKWKYRVALVADGKELTDELNRFGEDGWSLVTLIPMEDGYNRARAVFKRSEPDHDHPDPSN